MKITRWPAIALVALALLAVSGIPIDGATAQPVQSIEFPSLTLNYRDPDGPGVAALTNQGTDAATGGARIGVTLAQNGQTFYGNGFVRQVDSASFVGAFWLRGPNNNAYVFTGTFTRGFAGWTAEGRYEVVEDPSIGAWWTMATAPCPVC